MLARAMATIDTAMSHSTIGGNQLTSGATPAADAARVIECATVKAVMMPTRGRRRRNGITSAKRNSR